MLMLMMMTIMMMLMLKRLLQLEIWIIQEPRSLQQLLPWILMFFDAPDH